MKYLISVIDDSTGLATPTEEADIDAFNDRLRADGHWVFAGGLGSPDPATVIDNRGDEAVFTDGPFVESKEYLAYLATGPDTDPVRHDLTAEAIRLTRLIRALMPEDGEVAGLLALMLLTEARRTARVSASGELVTLDEQDRGTWDAALVAEGHRLVRERLAAREAPGRYQILAAINAVHTSARDVRDTDWSQVVALYDQLVRLDPSPIIALNRAIAVAELDGPEVALAAVDRLEHKLVGYHAYHATRAELLRRLGRSQKSRAAYDKAIELAGNTAETAYLTRRREQLE
jgi:RNA polymerase sigma-70 factor (ECF subfamily)